MGSEQTLKHFSHPHLLEISPYQETKNAPTKCSACKFDAAGWICTCKECNYLIHFQCSQSPRQIQLPLHKEHILSLASESTRRSRNFICRACDKAGDGFSYSCTDCNVHIHFLCATLPQMVAHESHKHPLDLEFLIPDGSGTRSFHCGICYDKGSKFNQWLYRCNECGFHAHLDCAKPKPTFAFSSSATGTNNVSDGKGSPNSAPFEGPSYGRYDDNSQRGEFDTGSNSATGASKVSNKNDNNIGDKRSNEPSGFDAHSSSATTKPTSVDSTPATGTGKANDKNGRSSSTSPFKGHDDNEIRSSQPGGSDAHSGGTTRRQTFGGSNSANGTGKPSNEKGSVNSALPKGSPHATKDGSGDDDGKKTRRNEPGTGGSDAHSGGSTRKQTFGGSNSATGTGKPSNEKGSVNSATPIGSGDTDGNKTRRNEPGPGGDGHSGSTTPNQTFHGANPTTATGEASNEKGSTNSAMAKGRPHETKDYSDYSGKDPSTWGPGQDGVDAHPGSKNPQYNYDTSDSDSDDNDDVIDHRKSKK